jgi:hypothetical protein
VEPTLESLQAHCVLSIKAEARRRILLIMDKDQQDNALALATEMMIAYGLDPVAWPVEARATYEATLPKWEAIKAIRAASNEIESGMPGDIESLKAFSFSDHPAWPS